MKVNKQLPHHAVAFGDEIQRHNLLLLWYSATHMGFGAAEITRIVWTPTPANLSAAQFSVDFLSVPLVYKYHLHLHPS